MVYHLLDARDLVTVPAFIVFNVADEFRDKKTARNQLWQADLTVLKVKPKKIGILRTHSRMRVFKPDQKSSLNFRTAPTRKLN